MNQKSPSTPSVDVGSVVDTNFALPCHFAPDKFGPGMLLMAVCTNSVVAILVLFVPSAGVGAVGVPVSAGLAFGANADTSVFVCVRLDWMLAIATLAAVTFALSLPISILAAVTFAAAETLAAVTLRLTVVIVEFSAAIFAIIAASIAVLIELTLVIVSRNAIAELAALILADRFPSVVVRKAKLALIITTFAANATFAPLLAFAIYAMLSIKAPK